MKELLDKYNNIILETEMEGSTFRQSLDLRGNLNESFNFRRCYWTSSETRENIGWNFERIDIPISYKTTGKVREFKEYIENDEVNQLYFLDYWYSWNWEKRVWSCPVYSSSQSLCNYCIYNQSIRVCNSNL